MSTPSFRHMLITRKDKPLVCRLRLEARWEDDGARRRRGVAGTLLRAVCMDRNLWGVENFQKIAIRHSKYAASRFAHGAARP